MEKERRGLTESFERLWSQALVAVSDAQEEASKAVQRLQEAAGWSQEEAKRYVCELTERLTQQRKDLEKTVDERVRSTLARVRAPRKEQIQDFQKRLDRLAERIRSLEG